MAEVDVKKASSKEQQSQGQQGQQGQQTQQAQQGQQGGLQRQQGTTGMARRGAYDPFNLSLIPDIFNVNPFTTSPFTLMRRMSDEMDRMFATALSGAGTAGAGGGTGAGTAVWAPAIEVKQRDNQLEISADLPGMSRDDVNVEITNDAVIIQGERKWESEEERGGVRRSERRYGQFFRAIPLPENANAEQARAQFRDGVLQITVPLSEQKSNRRQIPIDAGSQQGTSQQGASARQEGTSQQGTRQEGTRS
jgi:HSP20 family protein